MPSGQEMQASKAEVISDGDVCILVPRDSFLGEAEVATIAAQLRAVIAQDIEKVVVDLSRVECFVSAFLGVLLLVGREAARRYSPRRVPPPPPGERHCGGFVVYPDRESAVAAAGQGKLDGQLILCSLRPRVKECLRVVCC